MSNLPSIIIPVETSDCPDSQDFKCEFCGLCYKHEKDYLNHIDPDAIARVSESGEVKSRVCKICKKLFITHRAMRQHFGKSHSKPKKIKCKVCSRKFKNNYALKYHKRQVHDKATLVKCDQCQKVLYNSFRLKEHLRTCDGKIAHEDF